MHNKLNLNVLLSSLLFLSLACIGCKFDSIKVTKENLSKRIYCYNFQSPALQKQMSFCVVLPEGYSKQKDWPVLYLLHGRGRDDFSLINDSEAREALLQSRFVTVLPQGDDGWYINSPVNDKFRYADYLNEIVAISRSHLGVSKSPVNNAFAGWSMGGYGACSYVANNSCDFSALALIIGLLDFPREGLPKGQSYTVPTQTFGEDKAIWARCNPVNLVDNLKGKSIMIITADSAFDRAMNLNFAAMLTSHGISYKYTQLQGGHTFDVVKKALPQVIKFMNKHFYGEK